MHSKSLSWSILIVLSVVWGSSFILIKRGLVGLTPFQLGSLRIIFAAVFLLAIGFKTLPNIPQGKWKYIPDLETANGWDSWNKKDKVAKVAKKANGRKRGAR